MRTIANPSKDDQPSLTHNWTANLASLGAFLFVIGLSLYFLNGHLLMASVVLAGLMLMIARIDFTDYRIPDLLSLPSIPLGLANSASLAQHDIFVIVAADHAIAAVAAALALWGVRTLYWRIRHREGLGLGDVKLAATAGAWVGLEALPHVLLLACGFALVGLTFAQIVLRRSMTATSAIPFGTALAPAVWVVWFLNAMS